MSEQARLRKRLEKLHRQRGGKCHWCGCVTLLRARGDKTPNRSVDATIDHLDSRLSGRRGQVEGERTVLACYQCNNDRGVAESLGVSVERLRESREKRDEIRKQKLVSGLLSRAAAIRAATAAPQPQEPKE